MSITPISNLPSGQSIYSPSIALTIDTANVAWSWITHQTAVLIMTENCTLQDPTGLEPGKKASLWVIQNDTTAKELYYTSAYQPSTDLPLITTALNSVCYIEWVSDGTNVSRTNFQQNIVI